MHPDPSASDRLVSEVLIPPNLVKAVNLNPLREVVVELATRCNVRLLVLVPPDRDWAIWLNWCGIGNGTQMTANCAKCCAGPPRRISGSAIAACV